MGVTLTLFVALLFILYWFHRSLTKHLLRLATGKCELQRICNISTACTPAMPIAVGQCLAATRHPRIKASVQALDVIRYQMVCADNLATIADMKPLAVDDERCAEADICDRVGNVVDSVCIGKHINVSTEERFFQRLYKTVWWIYLYNCLKKDCIDLAAMPYDASNECLEKRLLQFASSLSENEDVVRKSRSTWSPLGFQGDDPATDFRGMGLLGFINLFSLSVDHSASAQRLLSHSHHPQYGYPLAIASINLTSMALKFLRHDILRPYFYWKLESTHARGTKWSRMDSLRFFADFHVRLLTEFDAYWMDFRPSSVMEFEAVRDKFENAVKNMLPTLKSDDCSLVKVDA